MLIYETHQSKSTDLLYHVFNTSLTFPLHLHHSFEFFYVEEGQVNLQVSNRSFSVAAGQAALIFPGQPHAYHTPVFAHSYLCVFSCDYAHDFYTSIRGKEAETPVFPLKDPSCIAMLSTPQLNHYLAKSALYTIIGTFSSCCPLRERKDEGFDLLEKSIAYVQEHFREPVSLRTLAAKFGCHYNYLSTYLNRHLDMHFNDFVNSYRINHACELLEHSLLTITEIADACGFDTIRSFNQNFRKMTGKTPSQYRMQNT